MTGPGPVVGSQRQPCLLAAVAWQTEKCACAKLKVWIVIRINRNNVVRLKKKCKRTLCYVYIIRGKHKVNNNKKPHLWCLGIFVYFQIKTEDCDRNCIYLSQWQRRTCSHSECTKARGHAPLPSDPAQLQQVHLPRDRHSATSDKIKNQTQRSSAISFSTFSIGQWSSYLQCKEEKYHHMFVE